MEKVIAGFLLVLSCVSAETPPQIPQRYMVQGILELPYAEIKEPFTGYFDSKQNMSRVDYYNGMVKTIQLTKTNISKFGQSFKIAPYTTGKVLNNKTCFAVNGSENASIAIQPTLPDVSNFKKIDPPPTKDMELWQMVQYVGTKKNTYSLMWNPKTNAPVEYIMMGFDSLLGSHYDKYIIRYTQFNTTFSDEVFNIDSVTKGLMTCSGFPGPGDKEHDVMMNPMKEYLHSSDEHVSEMFSKFKVKHKKGYKSSSEEARRVHLFRQNVRFIHSKNRAGLTYKLAVNQLADLHETELKQMRGFRRRNGPNNAVSFNTNDYKDSSIPDHLDWRLFGAVTPVKDQAVCGSCWSFGTTGTVEGALFRKTNELVRLSQQELMDCSWGEGNNACDGGEDFRAYEFIMKHGLATEDMYGPYLAQDGYCNRNVTRKVTISGYGNVTTNSTAALKVALTNLGPISISIDAAHKSLSFYSHGVYFDEECGNTPDDLDHSVLAVGYGVQNGVPYWLIKNSWSTYWGNDGYVLMSQRNNMCGVLTAPTYVII